MNTTISKETLIEIIKPLIAQQLEAFIREHEIKAKEVSLLERLIRIEEELKAKSDDEKHLAKEKVKKAFVKLFYFAV